MTIQVLACCTSFITASNSMLFLRRMQLFKA